MESITKPTLYQMFTPFPEYSENKIIFITILTVENIIKIF